MADSMRWEIFYEKDMFFLFLFMFFAVSNSPTFAYNYEPTILSEGRTIYVPAYSHIYSGDRERPFLLTVTVGIRNIDINQSIKITTVDYYETQGNPLTKFIKTPIVLKLLESVRYVIPEKEKAVGSGANFIVQPKSCLTNLEKVFLLL